MAVYVNTNYSSLQGRRYLTNVNNQLTTTYQRLSSGMRINSAKDDAAGLQISNRLTAQINGLNQGNRNASDGIALAQTMESGMDEISGMLQKIRTLAVQASNGTNSEEDREALSKEASALATEIGRIADQTTYGGKLILKGQQQTGTIFSDAQAANKSQPGKMTLQVGSNKGDTITFEVRSMQFSMIASAAGLKDNIVAGATTNQKQFGFANGAWKVSFTSTQNSQEVISHMDKMIAAVDSERANLGAYKTDWSHPSAISPMLQLMKLTQDLAYEMLTSQKRAQIYRSRASFSRPQQAC